MVQKAGTSAGATENDVSDAVTAGFSQHDVDAARAQGVAEGTSAEHERIFGVVNCPEAVGRESIALGLAEDGLDPSQAAKSLARFPLVAAAQVAADTTDVLAEAMAASGASESGVTAVLGAAENTPRTAASVADEALDLLEMATSGNQRMTAGGRPHG